jgi:phosphatidate cytidylyltransferase
VLAQRVASAIVGVPLIILLIIAGGPWYAAALAAALAVATLEFQHMRREWLDPVSILTAMLVAGIAIGAYAGRIEWLTWLAAAAVVAPLASLTRPAGPDRLIDALWTLGGVTYVGFLGSFIVLLRYIDFDARNWVLLALTATFAIDTFAFFVGRAIGRHKLAPRISPKKTIEGFVGGYAAGFAAVILCNYFFDLDVAPAQIVSLAVALPIAATVGDLGESAMKRLTHVKDASELIPGHGGVLDRLDSILFTFATVYLFTQWVVY